MKSQLLIMVISGLFLIVPAASRSQTGSGLGNPSVRSPVSSATVPQSSFRSGLIQNPNPIDSSGNLIITGNVTGGKHFQGPVPYGSTTSFRGQLGTSSLDSFLRGTSDSTDFNRYRDRSTSPGIPTDRYRSFFSPTGTVTTSRAGQAGTLTPSTTRFDRRIGSLNRDVAAGQLAGQTSFGRLTSSGLNSLNLRPMSRTPQELERLISNELGETLPQLSTIEYLRSTNLTRSETRAEQYQEDQIEPFRTSAGRLTAELGQIENKASLLKESLNRDMEPPYARDFMQRTNELQISKQSRSIPGFASNSEELNKLISEAERKAKETKRPPHTSEQQQADADRISGYERIEKRLDDLIQSDTGYSPQDTNVKAKQDVRNVRGLDIRESPNNYDASRKRQDILRDTSDRVKTILGESKSQDSFSEDKFKLYLKAAQVGQILSGCGFFHSGIRLQAQRPICIYRQESRPLCRRRIY